MRALFRKKPILCCGIVFFLYSLVVGLLIQTTVVPKLFTETASVEGLIIPDSIGFHQIAVAKAKEINEKGWAYWELRPNGHSPAGIASVIYALSVEKPFSILPFNALVHALTACVVLGILLSFFPTGAAILGSMAFVLNPTAMEWVAQIHKDGLFVLGNLLLLLCLVNISAPGRPTTIARRGVYFFLGLAGIFIIWVARPHWAPVSFLFSLLIALNWIYSLVSRHGVIHSNRQKAFVLFCFLGLLLAQNYAANYRPVDLLFSNTAYRVFSPSSGAISNPADIISNPADINKPEVWYRSEFLPERLDQKFLSLASARLGVTATGGATLIDGKSTFNSANDVLSYVPRALQIGLFSPFPDLWIGDGSTPVMTLARKVTGFFTLMGYLGIGSFFVALVSLRKRTEFRALAIMCFSSIILLAIVMPNIGTLIRMRFGFYAMCMAFGVSFLVAHIQRGTQKSA